MSKIALTDETGGWFEDTQAVRFEEQTRWNGQNRISVATGSQWEHEALYYTRSGNWVLTWWSQRQGTGEAYRQIPHDDAITWLIRNECFEDAEIDELPNAIQQVVRDGIAAAEI